MSTSPRSIKIAITAMGGQGGGVLSDWLVMLAEGNNCYAQTTSVPGVAQRTGATVYYVEIFPKAQAELAGKPPIMALMPVAGDCDIVVAGELVEAGRAMLRGFVTPDQSTLIASNHRDYAYTEKAAMGDGRINADAILAAGEEKSKRFICFDMATIAEQAGSVISAVLFGAIAGSGELPFSREQFEDAVRAGGVGVDASLRAFAAGYDRVANPQPEAEQVAESEAAPSDSERPVSRHPQVNTLINRVYDVFPESCREVLMAGLRRTLDYQDIRYGTDYLNRMAQVRTLDSECGGKETDYALTQSVAKHLALWMTFEDTIRVADLKTRSSRFARVREEVQSTDEQLTYVTEWLHPRVEEICDTLPAGLGKWILRSNYPRKTIGWLFSRGRRIQTAKISGFVTLYGVAALRPFRRSTLRFENEMAAIDFWLNRIEQFAKSDYDLAIAIAECQRLVKGYGDTHERGYGNYSKLMEIIDNIATREEPALLLRELRDAALADEFGDALKEKLSEREVARVA